MLLVVFVRELFGLLADINIFNLSGVVFVVSLLVATVVSRLTPDEVAADPDTLWRRELLRDPGDAGTERAGLGRTVGLWYAVLVSSFAAIYAAFW